MNCETNDVSKDHLSSHFLIKDNGRFRGRIIEIKKIELTAGNQRRHHFINDTQHYQPIYDSIKFIYRKSKSGIHFIWYSCNKLFQTVCTIDSQFFGKHAEQLGNRSAGR